MEAMGGVNDSAEDATEAPQLKRKERERSPRPAIINSLSSSATHASRERIWSDSLMQENLIDHGKSGASSDEFTGFPGGIRTKVLPASGFSQFLVRDSLKEKAIALTHLHDGISLREWLSSNHCQKNKAHCLAVFRQVVEIVDAAHCQGVVLHNLRPSHFKLFPLNKVKYTGSVDSPGKIPFSESLINDDMECSENYLKRKGHSEGHMEMNATSSVKHQKHKENHRLVGRISMFPSQQGFRGDVVEEVSLNNLRYQNYGCDFQQPAVEITQSEERWYASPEELDERELMFSSNIYSLGVLLFELVCIFGSSEGHAAAMKGIRHRILPPNFLSENPKEAGFCLWLLHPEPSSRPKSREILKCDLLCESWDFPSVDRSSEFFDEEDAEADLLLHFLLTLKEEKGKKASKLVDDIGCLKADIEEVEKRHLLRSKFLSNEKDASSVSDKFNVKLSTPILNEERWMRNTKIENAYFSMRSKVALSESRPATRSDIDVIKGRDGRASASNDVEEWCSEETNDRLGDFFDGLCKYARYSKFEVRGVLRNGDILNSANVICSLSFDRDEDYFATAGVSKKIKIFEFDALLKDTMDIHYPVIEMSSKSRLSCICWNNYIKNYLASTDYDGIVQLWDASTGQGFTQYTEHQRRAWSVDFSKVDPTRLASGSDDCSVKLWSINEQKCTDTIRNAANVCCVQFSSHSTHLLAFGSANYKIHCYDLRYTRIPWCSLVGHGKAVSFVKFVDSQTLVSASTDGTLKLWDLNRTSSSGLSTDACSLTFTGHTNEKNFVGLTTYDGYIACGSETNEVYAYYRSLPMPITSHKFGCIDSISGQETSDDNGQFVSSVCWRGKSNMVVAANSTGTIKLLEMV
ncbi:Protein SUPPRESSOR OF PHYA-105 1 [Acorus gramineus]|uniref:Protein SUPPRESSOR OF PHYA-105 1 n=1 Tax=Acorus gramineus TaxID=55184 RepID=A0AAV9AVU2_ACOGR|nr:Protein SUPPRESSOR OF PHYA-105 1 [Acorus gramineus]